MMRQLKSEVTTRYQARTVHTLSVWSASAAMNLSQLSDDMLTFACPFQ